MPTFIEKLPGESIIILHLEGSIGIEETREAIQQFAVCIQKMPGPIYRINDVRGIISSSSDLMNLLMDSDPAAAPEKRIYNILVADRIMQLSLMTIGGMYAPHPQFESVDEALDYARAELRDMSHPVYPLCADLAVNQLGIRGGR